MGDDDDDFQSRPWKKSNEIRFTNDGDLVIMNSLVFFCV